MSFKILFLFTLTTANLQAQFTTNEEIKIAIVKSKLVDNQSFFNMRQLAVKSKELRKVLIKTRIESKKDDHVKLSAFALLDTKNKIRYRLADYLAYNGIIGLPETITYRRDKIYKENGKEFNSELIPKYDESEKDYFYDFNQEGYKNFELTINFGTEDKPKSSVLYFGETEFTKFTGELYFAVFTDYLDSKYELFYKNEKISEITFQ